MRTALLVGATGLTGSHCLDLLLEDESYKKITVLTRRLLPQNHDKLDQHVVDFNNLSASAAIIKADDVFCCLGTTIKKAGSKEAFRQVDFEYPEALASIAAGNGSEQFLVISAPESNPNSMLFYGRVKGEMEQAVSQHPFNGVYIFQPSLLVGERDKFRLAEGMGIKILSSLPFLLSGPLKKLRPIQARAVASAMIVVAKSAPGGKRVYTSTGFRRFMTPGAWFEHRAPHDSLRCMMLEAEKSLFLMRLALANIDSNSGFQATSKVAEIVSSLTLGGMGILPWNQEAIRSLTSTTTVKNSIVAALSHPRRNLMYWKI